MASSMKARNLLPYWSGSAVLEQERDEDDVSQGLRLLVRMIERMLMAVS